MLSREQAKSKLIYSWRNDDLTFLAEFKVVQPNSPEKKPYGAFYLKDNDKQMLYPILEGYSFSRTAWVFTPFSKDLIEGKVYWVKVDIADDQFRERTKHPFQLKLVEIFEIEQSEDHMSAKNFIAHWFGRKGENPGDAASIAGQLLLNQLELYTQTKRFIFELIQNADDMPMRGRPVQIEIRLLENYFIFRHNGQYFSRGDVRAISDAAKSTKREDETKTGYKGIGFKSVFSDSETVFIFSQDYTFKFDKSSPIYKDFIELYRPYWSRFSVEEQTKFFNENRGKEKLHTNIEHIPWQIKPIWTELNDLPDEIRPYFSRSKNVNIALKVGASKIKEKRYDEMIAGLVDDPRFLLFLRNVRKIEYWPPVGSMKIIEVAKANDITEIIADGQLTSAYRTFDAEIEINNQAFFKAGFNFEHVHEEGKFAFKDANGNVLNNIPEKLGRLRSTTLSFAIKMLGDRIEKIPTSESILYNYLPTSDQRYRFPFIINADFISKTDREGILSENIWNHYLFFNIGYELTKWLNNLSSIDRYLDSYLNVLPNDLLDEKHEDLGTINSAFNQGLLTGIAENAFIPNDAGARTLASSLLIDDTGLAGAIGWKAFSDFTGTEKALASPLVNVKKLKTQYLNIEVFGFKELKGALKDSDKLDKLNNQLKEIKGKEREIFISWLDQACQEQLTFLDIAQIGFIKVGKENPTFLNVKEFQANKKCLFRTELTGTLFPQLKKANVFISNFSLDTFAGLRSVVKNDTYLANDKLIYGRFVDIFSDQLPNLTIDDRRAILEALRKLEGIDTGTVSKLPWYRNNLGEFKVLANLFQNEDWPYPSAYNSYFIHQQDKEVLGKPYTDLLNGLAELLKINDFFLDIVSESNGNSTIDLLSRLIKKGEFDNNIYPQLAKKIRLDGSSIAGDLYLDTITTILVNESNKQIQVDFKLRDLLPTLSEGSKNVSKLLDELTTLSDADKAVLRTKVFVLQSYNPSKIETTILSQKEELNFDQLLYLLIPYWFNKQTGTRRLILAAPNMLTKAGENETEHTISRLLDFMIENEVPNKDYRIEYAGHYYYLISEGTIICNESDLVFDTEQPDKYIADWYGGDEAKKRFLVAKGAFDETYSHIRYRKAVRDRDIDTLTGLSEKLTSSNSHFVNTAKFLEVQQAKGSSDLEWCEKPLIEFYNKFSGIKSINFEKRQFPVFDNDKQRVIKLELLNKDKSYYRIQSEWGIYKSEIAEYIFSKGNYIIPENLVLPPGYITKIAKCTEVVDKDQLTKSSSRYDAKFYEDWSKYDEHVINVYDGNFIPYQIIFEGEVLTTSVMDWELVWDENKYYFVCKSIVNEIPFCLKSMSPADAMSLAREKFYPRNQNNNSNNSELTEEEISELERLFNRKLSSLELSNHWLLACFKALKHYKTQGYDVAYAERNFESSMKKRLLEKVKFGGAEFTILPRSAKQNLLRITLAAWNSLDNAQTELFVTSSSGYQIFKEKTDLMDNSDNLLFTVTTDNKDHKTRIVSNLFENESISESQYDHSIDVVLLVQLKGGSKFSNLFSRFTNNSNLDDF